MTTKPFVIPKRLVWEAYQRVKANQGAAGVDAVSIEAFDQSRNSNLYRIWNRLSSGSYIPPPVKAVPIPKKSGGMRVLGVPTVGDRIAQTAVAMVLEPLLEPVFHADSYGYRPGKSAHDALAITRQRCWQYDWVLEYDIRALFDEIDHLLLMKALRHHCDERWVLLHVERWLTAPIQGQDGPASARTRGVPQGGPLSPILANLFLHYALDHWLARHHPDIPFCRYADDGILHCQTEVQAEQLREQVAERLRDCGLEMHPQKTRVVYCKDSRRTQTHEHIQFDFLGYTFRPRRVATRHGRILTGFTPAVSRQAMTAMRQSLRQRRLFKPSRALLGAARQVVGSASAWLDGVLLSLSGVGVPTGRRLHRLLDRSLGHAEIQTLARS